MAAEVHHVGDIRFDGTNAGETREMWFFGPPMANPVDIGKYAFATTPTLPVAAEHDRRATTLSSPENESDMVEHEVVVEGVVEGVLHTSRSLVGL